jgi:hypothetical protein
MCSRVARVTPVQASVGDLLTRPGTQAGPKQEKESDMQTENTKPNRPTHLIWQVIGDGDNAFWQTVGAAWAFSDGKGMFLKFNAHPIVGRTVIREISAKDAKVGEGQ